MAHGGYLPTTAHFRLDQACMVLDEAFGHVPYLVGSALERADYRDVDVRLILPDDEFAAMFPRGGNRADPRWSLLCASIGLHLGMATDLPIDFQIQSMTDANRHAGIRDPLGIFPQPSLPDGSASGGSADS